MMKTYKITIVNIIILSLLLLFQGCHCGSDIAGQASILQTNLPGGNKPVLLFTEVGKQENIRTFLLYAKGHQTLYIHKIELDGTNPKNYELELPPLPLTLLPGKENGHTFTVRFKPSGTGYFQAKMTFFESTQPEPITTKPYTVILANQDIRPVLYHDCPQGLNLGDVQPGQFKEGTCTITNKGNYALQIQKVAFEERQGREGAFTWKLSKPLPLTLQANSNEKLVLIVRYAPKESKGVIRSEADIVRFTWTTNDHASNQQKSIIDVQGRSLQNPLELVPFYQTCQNNQECQRLDASLGCTIEAFTGQKRCQNQGKIKNILFFPNTPKAGKTTRRFLIKNKSNRPVLLKHIKLKESNSPFQVQAYPATTIISPGVPLLVEVAYHHKDKQRHLTLLEVSVQKDEHIFQKTLVLQTQESSCILQAKPEKLLFQTKETLELTLSNEGNAPCILYQTYFKRGKDSPFSGQLPRKGFALAAGAKLTIDVQLDNTAQRFFKDTLQIESNSGVNPRLSIPLEDRKSQRKPCILQVESNEIDFGTVGIKDQSLKELTLHNPGTGTCTLSGMTFQNTSPKGSRPFYMQKTISFPYSLASGETLRIRLVFAPQQKGLDYTQELLVLESSGPASLLLKLKGKSTQSCVRWALSTQSIEFGKVQAACTGESRKVRLFHTGHQGCPDIVKLSEVRCNGVYCAPRNPLSPFHLSGLPPMPVTLKKGQGITWSVIFRPKSAGLKTQRLTIKHDIPSHAPLKLIMQGIGEGQIEQTDVFRQLSRSKSDILWVIDNSPSMLNRKASLQKNLKSFIQWVVRLNTDYHVGVITMDTSGKKYPAGCLQGTPKYVTPHTPNMINNFLRNVNLPISSETKSQGLEAAYQALTARLNDPKCNKGFRRKDASLSVIFVSAQDDTSPKHITFYSKFFSDIVDIRNQDLIRISTISGPVPKGCSSTIGGKATPGTRYWQLAKEFRGVRDSICSSNWGGTLMNLNSVAFGYRTEFFLSKPPVVKSIQVKVNGVEIKQDLQDGWQFEPSNNSIQFSKSQIPPPSATIEIRYTVACLPQ